MVMNFRKTVCLLSVLCILLMFVSCGSVKESFRGADAEYPSENFFENTSYNEKDDGYYSDVILLPEKDPNTGAGIGKADSPTEKIIRTVSLRAQSKEFDKAFSDLRRMLADCGGYEEAVESNGREYGNDSYFCRKVYLKMRVPADKLNEFLDKVGGAVNIVSENSSLSNATEEYYDVAARVEVLESERQAYEEMLKKAEDLDSILKIKDRLYDVIAEIESGKARMKVIDSRAAYSTVIMQLEEVMEYSSVTTPKTTFGNRIKNAFTQSWQSFGYGWQNFAVGFVGAIPILLMLAFLAGIVVVVIVSASRRSRNRRQKRDEENE